MRRFIFWLSYFVVAVAVLSIPIAAVLAITKASLASYVWLGTLQRFASPMPSMAVLFLPWSLQTLVTLLFSGLVIRRLFIAIREKTFSPPIAYSGVPYFLLCLSAISLVLGVIALVAVNFLPREYYMLAIRTLNPSMLLAPLAITWAELKSLKFGKKSDS